MKENAREKSFIDLNSTASGMSKKQNVFFHDSVLRTPMVKFNADQVVGGNSYPPLTPYACQWVLESKDKSTNNKVKIFS